MEIMKLLLELLLKFSYPSKHNLLLFIYGNNLWFLFWLIIFIASVQLHLFLVNDKKYTRTLIKDMEANQLESDLTEERAQIALFEYIDFMYYVKNIYETLVKVLFYFTFAIGLYIVLRFYMIGHQLDLSRTNLYSYLTFKNLAIFIYLLYLIGLFRLFITTVIYRDVLKLYIYLFEIYSEILLQRYSWQPGFFIRSSVGIIQHWLYYTTLTKEQQAHIDNIAAIIKDFEDKQRIKLEKIIWNFAKDKSLLITYIKSVYIILCKIGDRITAIIQETAWLTVLIALLYDIHQCTLYYTYYALLVYTIRIFYRKFSEVLFGLFWEHDNTLHYYMYKTPYYPNLMWNQRRIDTINALGSKATPEEASERNNITECTLVQLAISESMLNGSGLYQYITSYLKYQEFPIHHKKAVREFVWLVLSLICCFYLIFYIDIEIIITFIPLSISLTYLILCITIYQIYFWYYKIQTSKAVFWLISYTICLLTFLIYLNHHIPMMYTDIILDFDLLKIIDHYTIEEKVYFLHEYAKQLVTQLPLSYDDQQYILKLLKRIPYAALLENSTTFSMIMDYVHHIMMQYILMQTQCDTYLDHIRILIQQEYASNAIKILGNIIIFILTLNWSLEHFI